MPWTDLLDQHRVTETLRRALASDRIAHAYLFYGPDGVGKRAAALALAQALQCERGGDTACGKCLACTKVARMLHPDVHLLIPYPSDADPDDVAERLSRLAEHPYATIDYVRRPVLDDPSKASNKQAAYTVARINDTLRRAMSLRPVEGRYKVAVLTDAELLRTEAANAFLKLLEEPGPRTVFVLTSSRPDRLLPTIVSRCQKLRFDPLPAEALEAALRERDGLPGDRAAMVARMADGSYSRALDLAGNDDLMAGRKLVLDFLRIAYVRNVDKLADHVEQMSRMGREPIKSLLGLLLSWLRDLMLYRTLGDAAPLVNVDQADAVARFCDHVPEADLEAMVRLTEEAIDLVERNVHQALVLTTLAQALGRAMHGPHPGRLYTPLVEPAALARA